MLRWSTPRVADVGWVTTGLVDVGDGREKPHILVPGLAGAGSKVPRLGLPDGGPARPRSGANATRATGTWGGMWGGLSIRLCN